MRFIVPLTAWQSAHLYGDNSTRLVTICHWQSLSSSLFYRQRSVRFIIPLLAWQSACLFWNNSSRLVIIKYIIGNHCQAHYSIEIGEICCATISKTGCTFLSELIDRDIDEIYHATNSLTECTSLWGQLLKTCHHICHWQSLSSSFLRALWDLSCHW